MEYFNLIMGIVLTVTFIWLFVKNSERTSLLHAAVRIDTVLGVIAGVYLIFTSAWSILVQ